MQLIDGKATATAIKAEIAEEVKAIMAKGGKQPHLAAVLVGHDGGSETYVKNKVLACEACGFKSTLIRYEDDITEEELLACVDKLNKECRWLSSYQCGAYGYRTALLYLGYTSGHHYPAEALWHRDLWKEVRHSWP